MPTAPATELNPTQDRIRQAAVELLAESGYGGTSMADIAQRVGLSKAGLYNYFASKEELLLDLLERSIQAWREASSPVLAGQGSCRERLGRHLRSAVEFTVRKPHDVAVVRLAATQIGGDLGRRVQVRLARQKRNYLERLEAFFTEAIERGEVLPAEPRDLSLAWRSFVDGLLLNLIFPTPESELFASRLDAMWQVAWRGLSGKPLEEGSP